MLTVYLPQESELVYCGRLSLVADLLQGLFKEAYALQKGLLEVLDRMSVDSGASDDEVSEIVTGVFIWVVQMCILLSYISTLVTVKPLLSFIGVHCM